MDIEIIKQTKKEKQKQSDRERNQRPEIKERNKLNNKLWKKNNPEKVKQIAQRSYKKNYIKKNKTPKIFNIKAKIITNIEIFNKLKDREFVEIECLQCKKICKKLKREIKHKNVCYCSTKCGNSARKTSLIIPCGQCAKPVEKCLGHSKRTKTGKVFCSHECSTLYQHINLPPPTNRKSKLENWLKTQLIKIYPNLLIKFNDREILNGLELDIYIPSINLAFELNGIYHYEDIWGQLNKVQKNDQRKFVLCAEKNIGLCVIDTTGQKHTAPKYFKEKSVQPFLDIIINIINNKLNFLQ